MQGKPIIIAELNKLLAGELSAIDQYFIHSRMYQDWGYSKLFERISHESDEEKQHASWIIERILFLEGIPIVSKLSPIHIGSDVPKMFQYDHEAEAGAIAAYNEAIMLAGEVKDYATREILEHILNDEDAHIDAIEENQDQIGHMTLGIYLTTKVD